jgi:hypothetical protein
VLNAFQGMPAILTLKASFDFTELRKLEKQRLAEHDAFLKHEATARATAEKALEMRTTENERLTMELMQARAHKPLHVLFTPHQ